MNTPPSHPNRPFIYIAFFCSVLALVQCGGFLLWVRRNNSITEFAASIGPGMTQQECLVMHGQPHRFWGPGETVDLPARAINEPRTDQGAVWLYEVTSTFAVLLYFDEDGRCARIRTLMI